MSNTSGKSLSGTAQLSNGTLITYNSPTTVADQAFPTRITDPQGNYINITYRNNRGPEIQTVTDTMGRVITFNYDSLNRLISVDVPKYENGGTQTAIRLHYKQITLSPGFASGITTDTATNYPYVIDAIYYPATNTGYWFDDTDSYSSYGMIAKVKEMRGMSWSGTAGTQGTITPGTMSKQSVYDYPATADYSLNDAPTSSTGAYSQIIYNDAEMKITEEAHESGGALAGQSVKYLNGIGQVIKEESPGAGGVLDIVEAKYTNLGQPWKQTRPFRSGDTLQWSETFSDIQGRTIKVQEPDGSYSQAFHNETTARPSSASASAGQTVRVVDAWGRERWGRYDAKGKLAEVVEPSPSPTGNGTVTATGNLVTSYQYDALNRLTETTQGNQTRRFKYDSLGRLTRQKLAEQTAALNDLGQYVGGTGTWSEAFWYDTRSNLTMKTDARGVKTHFSYQTGGADDPLNRLQSRVYDLSGLLEPNQTIHAAPSVTYEYMTAGDKTRISRIRTAGILTEDYIYDGESRVSSYTQTVDSRTSYPLTVSYLYDTLSRVKEVHYPAQYGIAGSPRKVVEHIYDTASRLTSLKVGGQ